MKIATIPSTLKVVLVAGGVCILAVVSLFAMHAGTQPSGPGLSRSYSAGDVPTCGSQLGVIGFSVETAKGYAGEGKPEFTNLAASHFNPGVDLSTSRFVAVGSEGQGQAVARLNAQPHVIRVDTVTALSSDRKYLSCDYKLRDNAVDQQLASTAESALIAAGADAKVLSNDGTMEFVSIRGFGLKQFLQVAFVSLPVDGPHISYAVLFDKSTLAIVWAGQTNWYS
jgi:hypothetical protein